MSAIISAGLMNQMNIDREARQKLRTSRCPICNGIEGCDHTMMERLRALEDTAYRDQMRRDDPLCEAVRQALLPEADIERKGRGAQ